MHYFKTLFFFHFSIICFSWKHLKYFIKKFSWIVEEVALLVTCWKLNVIAISVDLHEKYDEDKRQTVVENSKDRDKNNIICTNHLVEFHIKYISNQKYCCNSWNQESCYCTESSCNRTVPSAIWEIFPEFLLFFNLFHEPLYESNNSKIWETRKLFANIERSNMR